MSQLLKKWTGPGISLILLSIVVVVLFQYMPKNMRIVSSADLLISLFLLGVGMLCQYLLWHVFVTVTTTIRGFPETFISHSLMIWSKYIPGKIWSIMGRAGYLARQTDNSLTALLAASTGAQVVMLVTGLGCGLSFLLLGNEGDQYLSRTDLLLVTSIVAAMLGALGFYLYTRVENWRKSCWQIGLGVVISICAWMAWGLGLSHLMDAIDLGGRYWRDIGIFSAASSAGIIAIVAPGGLGVREGAMSVLLSLHGMDLGNAAFVGLVARVWFVLGELVLFASGLLIWHGRSMRKV